MRKYQLIICLILYIATPFLINYLVGCQNPTQLKIVGNGETWINFWSVYFSGLIPFIALWFTIRHNRAESQRIIQANKEQNDLNRQLQIDTIKYQMRLERLEKLRTAIVNMSEALSFNVADKFINKTNCLDLNNVVSAEFNKVNRAKSFLGSFLINCEHSQETEFVEFVDKFCRRYFDLLFDLEFLHSITFNIPNDKLKQDVVKYRESKRDRSIDCNRIWSIIESRNYQSDNKSMSFYHNKLMECYHFDIFEKKCRELIRFEKKLAEQSLNETK